jgi:single-strand DNA-binding protein
MASNINSVVLTGNLTSAPEKRGAQGNVVTMRLAVNGRRKNGEVWEDDPNFFDVIAFGQQGELCCRFLGKGSAVAVAGRLDWNEWTNDAGERRQSVQVVAQTVQFLSSQGDSPNAPRVDAEDKPKFPAAAEEPIPF